MKINWDVVTPSIWSAVGGGFAGMLLLSYGFGFMGPTAAANMARAASERAVVTALAPVCADKFAALPDAAARTASLTANKEDSYKMRESFPDALVTLPGRSYTDSDLIAACAALILAPKKAAVIKQ
jgi:hypothetical protein